MYWNNHTENYSEDNPQYVIKGLDADGNEFEEMVDASKINPNNCSFNELMVLNVETGHTSPSDYMRLVAVRANADADSYFEKADFNDVNMAPPEDFVYCSNATWDGEASLDGLKEYFAGKNAESPFKLFLLAAVKNIDAKESLLLNHENYMAVSEWEDNDIYQNTMSFLKNFNISWNYGSNRFEFLSVK